MSMANIMDHPDIAAAGRDGYPSWAAAENQDTPEARREFAEENIAGFIAFALAGDPDILDNFAADPSTGYRDWLN